MSSLRRILTLALTVSVLLFGEAAPAQAQDFVWARAMGGTSDDSPGGMTLDGSGNVHTVGGFSGTADFDPGPGTFNLTSAGNQPSFVSKLDSSGNFVWARAMGGDAFHVALDGSGNVHIVGEFTITNDFDPGAGTFNLTPAGSFDIFVVKLEPPNEPPGAIYAGTGLPGVFKSTDGGATWINVGVFSSGVEAVVIDPTNPAIVYAGTGFSGVFRSLNGGATWASASTGLPSFSGVRTLAIDPANPSTLYAGVCPSGEPPACPNGGAFKSTNGAASWFPINTGITNKLVRELAIDPTQTSTIYAASHGRFFKSTDAGAGWAGTPMPGSGPEALVIDPQNTATLYLGLTLFSLWKSTDAGASWAAASNGLLSHVVTALDIDPSSPLTLYSGTFGGGIFKTTNGASNWAAINSWLLNTTITALAVDPATTSTVYAGTAMGVFKTTNAGASWFASSSGLPLTRVTSLAIFPAKPPVANAGSDQTLECTGFDGASMTLDGSGSFDPDLDPLTFTWTGPFPEGGGSVTGVGPTVTLPIGSHTIILTVEDDQGASDTDDVMGIVQDTTKPTLTLARNSITISVRNRASEASVDVLAASGAAASDLCDPSPLITTNAPDSFPVGVTMVTIAARDASGNVTRKAFRVEVTTPRLEISPKKLMFDLPEGSEPASQPFTVRAINGRVIYVIHQPASWVHAEPDSGVSSGEVDQILAVVGHPRLPPGTYTKNLSFRENGVLTQKLTVTLIVQPVDPPPPFAPPEYAVVDAASFIPSGQPGHEVARKSIIAIFGENFTDETAVATTIPLPTTLAGIMVTFDGIKAPLFAVTPNQIIAQLPMGVEGDTATMVVTKQGQTAQSLSQEVPSCLTHRRSSRLSRTGRDRGSWSSRTPLTWRGRWHLPQVAAQPERAII